jgi:hypothetical protein
VTEEEAFRNIITNNIARYPRLEARDLYKLVHQAAMGSEHAVSSPEHAASWLEREVDELVDGPSEPAIDPISPDHLIVRVNLRPFLFAGGDAGALLAAFVRTANEHRGDREALERYWGYIEKMAGVSDIAFDVEDLKHFFALMSEDGFPAAHHSVGYETAYHPAYRVVRRDLLPSLDETG